MSKLGFIVKSNDCGKKSNKTIIIGAVGAVVVLSAVGGTLGVMMKKKPIVKMTPIELSTQPSAEF